MSQNDVMRKGPVTRCNFPGNLQRNSTLKEMQISGECLICISKLCWKRVFANFTSTKSKIALQVARKKIAPCDRALIHVCLALVTNIEKG